MEYEMTLLDARRYVQNKREEGVFCPCCGQYAKTYRRKLNSEMALWLIWLVKQFKLKPDDWVDVKTAPLRGGDYGKLIHWGLAAQCLNTDKTKRTSGLWKPTEKGIHFSQRRVRVPSHVYLYNNEVLGFRDTLIDIEEALGERFDYAELMGQHSNGD